MRPYMPLGGINVARSIVPRPKTPSVLLRVYSIGSKAPAGLTYFRENDKLSCWIGWCGGTRLAESCNRSQNKMITTPIGFHWQPFCVPMGALVADEWR